MASEHPGIQLFLSNRLENLADALVTQMAENPGHPMRPDTLLIQNRGMARWLNLRIADQTGIQMNTRFVYPRSLIEDLLNGAFRVETTDTQSQFSQEVLFWKIYDSLPRWSKHPKSYLLKRYLASNAEETSFLRRYQLAAKIAQHFDQLQNYRPDLVRSWMNQKKPEDWRAVIWNNLNDTAGERPPAQLYQDFSRAVEKLDKRPSQWPDQIHIFAVSSLPPTYIDLIKTVAQWLPVNIYLTQPSPLYWGDQLSKKKLLKATQTTETTGHGLLGNLGRQGQDFLNTLIDAEVFAHDDSEFFEAPGQAHLLQQLQTDLYQLAAPSTSKQETDGIGIQIKNCHSERREIEVLKDVLLQRFQEDKELKPDQIVIMAPNIEDYAASIRSVFGTDRNSKVTLPYSIADYSSRSSSSVAHAVLALLELLQSRFTANDVMTFVNLPAVSDSFEIGQKDIHILRTWIEDTSIRWGINGKHRESASGTFFEQYAWQPGIDRLISGSCIHPDEKSDWDPLLPHPHIEGSSLALLNRFLELWQFLERNQTLATQVQRSSSWLETIKDMITFLFTRLDAHYEECLSLFDLLSTLGQEIEVAKADDSCDLKVIQNILEDRLAKDIQAGSFFTGSITFCSMMPMRNVPAKFIGLIGMREDAYPRQEIKTEFSQFPDGPRIGDRSQREDDRYLFLESILAARGQLYISYTGIDSQTLNEEPASIVVEELLDTLDDYYRFPNEESARQALVKTEPLQAFSPSNFEEDAPQSFSEENLRAAQTMIQPHSVSEGLNIQSSSEALNYPDSVSIDQLQKFFLNPSQYWLSEILETNFPYNTQSLEDSEPIEPNSLEVYQWGEAILNDPDILSGKSEYKLESLLPVGALGKLAYERLATQLSTLLEQWNALPSGEPVTVQLDQQLEELHISGAIAGATNRNYKHMRFGKIRSADILSGWIRHLFLCQHLEATEFKTHLIGKEATYSFERAQEPEKHLLDLKRLFFQGHSTPLPFFVQAAYTFSKASLRPSPRARKTPIDLAYGEFTKLVEFPFLIQGEAYNRYNQLCFPDPTEALASDFEDIALKVFGPAIEHMEGGLP